jgi:hypothetical protein
LNQLTDDDRIRLAEQSSMLAVLSVILCLMASCGCVTVFIAFPLSMWGLSLARTALDTPDPSPTLAAWAGPARTFNLVALIHSGLMCFLIVSYITVYVGMIGLMVVLGALA